MNDISVIRASKEKAKRNRDNWKARCEHMEGERDQARREVLWLADELDRGRTYQGYDSATAARKATYREDTDGD